MRTVTRRTSACVVAVVAALVLVASACSSSSGTTASGPGTPGTTGLPQTGGAPGSAPGTTAPKGPVASAGCSKPAAAPGTTDKTMMSDGVERQYQLIVPASYDGKKPLPVVLGLHALTVNYHIVPAMTGFGDMAPKYDFIGVAPSGRIAGGTTPYWHAAPAPDNYDLDFIGQLLDQLEADLCVDTTEVFSTGMSNGAQMSSLLACRMADRITAVAPVAGVEFFDTCKGRPVPVIAFHGTTDPIVTYEGGGLNATKISENQFWRGPAPAGLPQHKGVDAAMVTWAAHNGCDPQPTEERISPEVRKRTWKGCQAATELYMVDGGGHAWPGKPQPAFEKSFGHGTKDIDASTLIFQFFLGTPSS